MDMDTLSKNNLNTNLTFKVKIPLEIINERYSNLMFSERHDSAWMWPSHGLCINVLYRVSTKKVHFSPPNRKAKVKFFCGHPVLSYSSQLFNVSEAWSASWSLCPREPPGRAPHTPPSHRSQHPDTRGNIENKRQAWVWESELRVNIYIMGKMHHT